MRESDEALDRLSRLLERSIDRAGPFLRDAFEMPERSLSAEGLIRHLTGRTVVAFATVTRNGEPRVAPTDSVFYRGRFHIPTVATSVRARHISTNPAVSLTQYVGNDIAVVAHGEAGIVTPDHEEFYDIDGIYREASDQSPLEWGEGIYIRVEADRIFTFVRDLEF